MTLVVLRQINVRPFTSTKGDEPIMTAPEESQEDNEAAAGAPPIEGLTSQSGDDNNDTEGIPAAAEEGAEGGAAGEGEVETPPSPKPELVKRTSVKDRIRRVNSMERRSVKSKHSTDSPLNSQKVEYHYLIKIALMGDLGQSHSPVSKLANQFNT